MRLALFTVHIICISLYFKNNTTAWTLFQLHRNETLGNFPEYKPFARIKTFMRMTQHWASSSFLMIQVLQAVRIFPEKPAVRSTPAPTPTSQLHNANLFFLWINAHCVLWSERHNMNIENKGDWRKQIRTREWTLEIGRTEGSEKGNKGVKSLVSKDIREWLNAQRSDNPFKKIH